MQGTNTFRAPARYFPIEKGLYEVAPGLRTWGTSFGNGEADNHVFQIDSEFEKYRRNKIECRAEKLEKYFLTHEYSPEVQKEVARFMATRLATEHPKFFMHEVNTNGASALHCTLTGEILIFDSKMNLIDVKSRGEAPAPAYVSALDALSSQVQEDVTVMSQVSGERNWLSAIHLCAPGHWAAGDKVGTDFAAIHMPVPHIEKLNKVSMAIVDAMVNKGPYVRFVWGFATDTRLNHHPEPAPGWDAAKWKGRSFRSVEEGSKFYLRVERQVIWGFPKVNASLFNIRVYYYDGDTIRNDARQRELLKSGLLSMTPQSREYKGLSDSMDQVLKWLEDGAALDQ